MASGKRRKRREPQRLSTRRLPTRSPKPVPASGAEDLPSLDLHTDLDLLTGLDEVLAQSHPLPMLLMASGLVSALDPRRRSPFEAEDDRGLPSLPELCEMFLEVGQRQTDALLLVLGRMQPDEVLSARIRHEVAERRRPVPGWLLRLDLVEPYRAVQMTHVLGDGDNVVLGVRLPGERECSVMVYVDHNLGTVVKDAFVLEQPIAEIVEAWAKADAFDDTTVEDLPLTEARARITQAIDTGAMTFPPFETDSWPSCRPLTEWFVSLLPEGGAGYERPDWSEDALAALADSFFSSEFGDGLDTEDNRALLEPMLRFGIDGGPGDPLRWSPVAVELLLLDWVPRKLAYPAEDLVGMPELLRALIRYSHSARGISRELTAQTLAVVNECEPEYLEAIGDPQRRASVGLFSRLAEIDTESARLSALSHEEYMLEVIGRAVGGAEALDGLGTEPLPDEGFDWTELPADIHGRVAEVLDQVDGCCTALFDTEFRTACRRLLARIASGDPEIFRRKAAARTAAVCWIAGQANNSFQRQGLYVKDLMAYFGLTGTVSQRAEVLLRAVGADWRYGGHDLGDPELLVAARRAELVDIREYYRARLG